MTMSTTAWADNDGKALKLAEQALYEDYLNLEFDKAETKLKQAIALCETACRPESKAQVFRDMGVLKVAGQQKRAEGVEFFKKAIETYGAIELEGDLSTPEIEEAWKEARSTASSGDSTLDAMRESMASTEVEEEELPPELQERPDEPEPEPEPPPPVEEEPEPIEEEPARPAEKLDMTIEDCPPDFPGCESFDDQWAEEDAEAEAKRYPKYWFHLGYQADFLLMDSASGVCADATHQCFYAGGVYRDPSVDPIGVVRLDGTLGGAGEVQSGFVIATQRVMLGFDYGVTNEILLGVRAGFAFNGGPQKNTILGPGNAFLPIHAEARAAYWFAGVKSGTFRPFAELSGGVAQVDAKVQTEIIDRNPGVVTACDGNQDGTIDDFEVNCLRYDIDVWKKTGTVFMSGGLGTLIAFGDAHGLTVEGRLMQMFGSSGLGAAGSLGYALGF
jgi:hypothetical protein